MNRIRELRQKKGLTGPQLAKMLNISPQHLYDMEKGKRRIHDEIIQELVKIFGVSADYILGYSGETQRSQFPNPTPPEKFVLIPIYREVRAGHPTLAEEDIIGYECVPEDDVQGGKYFFVRVKGDSMINARLQDGDLVLVRQQDTLENGQIGVVIVNGKAMIKRFYRKGMLVVLKPENPAYEPVVAKVTDVRIIGQVVEGKIRLDGR
ncbi:LexA family protein [Calderihabitans maritimus]|uniref:Phage repressor like transcriptional regulator, XRE family n=1 Tax=Calderihabitans maritimus TaxID=1246530 RepID=A0A1Z5HSZ8_9FIRM|nr:S24 family peptidase [Calderihabitans maritimus]GAW92451.1 phage repressor like transcriptional regulator, XRE family [Calderihabitans maritimus]